MQGNDVRTMMIEQRGRTFGGDFRCLEFVPRGAVAPGRAVIYLHGIGERGDDLSLVTPYGLPKLLSTGTAAANCPVVCPQLEAGQEWPTDRLASLVARVSHHYGGAVALIGYSLGGLGVCDLVAERGAVVSLAIAIAGRCRQEAAVPQPGVTFLAVQGALDPWPAMARFVDSINAQGGAAREVTLAGEGHYISEQALWHHELQAALVVAGVELCPLTTKTAWPFGQVRRSC